MLFCDSLSDTGYRTGLECYFVLRLSFVSRTQFFLVFGFIASSAISLQAVRLELNILRKSISRYPKHLFDTEYNAAAAGDFSVWCRHQQGHIPLLCDKRILSWVKQNPLIFHTPPLII